MVRAGVVAHPAQWAESGYREVQNPPKRYRIVDVQALMELLGFTQFEQHQHTRAKWVEAALERGLQRQERLDGEPGGGERPVRRRRQAGIRDDRPLS